jgi:hypothetical protein
VIKKELITEVINPLVPQLHKFALRILVPLFGARNQGIGMHHSDVQERFSHRLPVFKVVCQVNVPPNKQFLLVFPIKMVYRAK